MKVIEGERGSGVGSAGRFDPLQSGTKLFYIPAWLMKRVEVTMTAKLVYGVLTGSVNPASGLIEVETHEIAEAMGTRDEKVERGLRELVKGGLIWETTDNQTAKRSYTFRRRPWMRDDIIVEPDLPYEEGVEPGRFLPVLVLLVGFVGTLTAGAFWSRPKVMANEAVFYHPVSEEIAHAVMKPKLKKRASARRTPLKRAVSVMTVPKMKPWYARKTTWGPPDPCDYQGALCPPEAPPDDLHYGG